MNQVEWPQGHLGKNLERVWLLLFQAEDLANHLPCPDVTGQEVQPKKDAGRRAAREEE